MVIAGYIAGSWRKNELLGKVVDETNVNIVKCGLLGRIVGKTNVNIVKYVKFHSRKEWKTRASNI